jgi:hypothetical protein
MGLILRTTTTPNSGNTVSIKGSALSYAEGDGNFAYLLTNMSGSNISITGSTGILGNTTLRGNVYFPNITNTTNNSILTFNSASGQIFYASTGSIAVGSASYAATASIATSASYAATASYVLNAVSASYVATASYVLNAISASYAATASYVRNAVSSSYAATASYAQNAQTASYVLNAVSSSYAATASIATSASYAATASTATSASYAATASTATSASWAPMRPAGSDTQIQYNSGSTLAANSSFAFVYTSQSLQQGANVVANGQCSHAEGFNTVAFGDTSHAEGNNTLSGRLSYLTFDVGSTQPGEIRIGGNVTASFTSSQLSLDRIILSDTDNDNIYGTVVLPISQSGISFDGTYTIIKLQDSSVYTSNGATITNYVYNDVINPTNTIGYTSHAEGRSAQSIGASSHAEGLFTQTIGDYSHAEGANTQAIGIASHAAGLNTVASGSYQSVIGQYNISSSAQSAFIIGNGTSNANRSNLLFASGSTVQISGSLSVTGSTNLTGNLSLTGSANILSGSASGSFVTNLGDTFTSTAAVTKIVSLSSAEYSGLGTKDSNTLYIII